MRLFRPFFFFRWLYPGALFRLRSAGKVLCLTFDDGPDPVSTPVILNILREHGIKAVFFCTGEAASAYPELTKRIKDEGHVIGNHGFLHKSGLTAGTADYISDVMLASPFTSFTLFRPAYGRIRPSQFRILRKTFRIIFWDIMPYDFDTSMDPGKLLLVIKRRLRDGSIIVLHDKKESSATLLLKDLILFAKEKGYGFSIDF